MDNIRNLHPRADEHAPYVALHCTGSNGRQWEAYRSLLPAGTVLHTPDLLGYGRDERWPQGAPVTLRAEAQRLESCLQPARPVHLVAHSYGGAVALQAALMWPERVRSLTLYEPVLFHLLYEDADSRDPGADITSVGRRIGLLALSGRVEDAAALFVGYWSGDAAWERMPEHRRQAVMRCMPKVRADFEALFGERFDVSPLAQTGIPIRLLQGARSPAPARRVVQLLAQRLPDAEVIELQDQGHMAPVTAPARMASLMFGGGVTRALRMAA